MSPLNLPDSIPESEADRTAEAQRMIDKMRGWGEQGFPQLTNFELEVLQDVEHAKACTRIRFKILRDAYDRIEKTVDEQ